jgi:predicted alpha/beta-hydrolase family hydrolase
VAEPENAAWAVQVGDRETRAVYDPPAAAAGPRVVFVCAHGAGGSRDDRAMLALRDALRARGIGVVRFNFLYKERGSGRPDPMTLLQETVAAVVARARAELHPDRLLIGGRSMGGRAASMLAAEGFACDGLLLLAYPLHPAGQPEKLRDAHLPAIAVPALCFNGTRDDLCRPDLMEAVLRRVRPTFTMHWLEGADHSFHVLKSSGRTDAQVLDEVGDATAEWLAALA